MNQWELPIFDLEIEVWLRSGQMTTIQETILCQTRERSCGETWHNETMLEIVHEQGNSIKAKSTFRHFRRALKQLR